MITVFSTILTLMLKINYNIPSTNKQHLRQILNLKQLETKGDKMQGSSHKTNLLQIIFSKACSIRGKSIIKNHLCKNFNKM